MSAKPWYAWYVGDARAKMRRLSLTERGAYRELLDEIYATGQGLPGPIIELCRIAGAQDDLERDAVAKVAALYLPVGDDGLRHNKRATREMIKQTEFKDTQSAKGKAGAAARWGNNSTGNGTGIAQAIPDVWPDDGRTDGTDHGLPQTTNHIPQPQTTTTDHSAGGQVLDGASKSNTRPKKINGSAQAPFVLPEWIPVEHWEAWIEARTKKRNAPTDYAKRLAVMRLANFKERGHPPGPILAMSAFNGWAGVFEPQEQK